MDTFTGQVGLTIFSMLTFHESVHLFSALCVGGATLGIVYNLLAAFLVLRFERPSPSRPACPRPVTVLKPLHGGEPDLFPRLASFCEQNYAEAIQLVCGTQQAADRAIDSVRLLQRLAPTRFPNSQVDLVIDEHSRGANPKVSNLVSMEAVARHDIVILSDSDIVVDDQFMGRVTAKLEHPSVGAVTCVYCGLASGGTWARVSALNINSQFLPNVIVALTFGAEKPCFGSAIVMDKITLQRIGGLRPFLDELADDHAIGSAVRAAGLGVIVPRFAVGHVCFERTLREFWDHHMRSARTIRSIDPVGYLGLIFIHPFMLSVLAALAGVPFPLALVAAAFASRVILNSSVERSFRLERQPRWLLALHDTISFAVFLSSFFGTEVTWRGDHYRLFHDGTIEGND